MKKSAEQLTVEVVGDVIQIQQKDPMGNHDDCVVVSADQVVQLIEWLRDAREHLQNNTRSYMGYVKKFKPADINTIAARWASLAPESLVLRIVNAPE